MLIYFLCPKIIDVGIRFIEVKIVWRLSYQVPLYRFMLGRTEITDLVASNN